MLKTIAAVLVATSLLAGPVLAQGGSTAPATTSQPAKADVKVIKKVTVKHSGKRHVVKVTKQRHHVRHVVKHKKYGKHHNRYSAHRAMRAN